MLQKPIQVDVRKIAFFGHGLGLRAAMITMRCQTSDKTHPDACNFDHGTVVCHDIVVLRRELFAPAVGSTRVMNERQGCYRRHKSSGGVCRRPVSSEHGFVGSRAQGTHTARTGLTDPPSCWSCCSDSWRI